MNFNWKDAIGLSALIFGFVMSGVLINQEKQHKLTPQAQTSKKVAKAKNHKQSKNSKKRAIQSVNNKHVAFKKPSTNPPIDIEFKSLMGCYYSEACDFPSKDPRQYKLQVGQKIKQTLEMAFHRIQIQKEKNPQKWASLSAKALAIEDGHVKQAALDVLSNLEPTDEAFDKIIKEVLGYHDAYLIPSAMAELQKYNQEPQKQKIYVSLAHVLQTGSLMVRKEILNHLDPFINKKSLPYFQNTLKKLNPDSNIHSSLYKIIKEYKRQKTGA